MRSPQPFQVYPITDQTERLIKPGDVAEPGSYRAEVTTADAGSLPYTADFSLDNLGGGHDPSCPGGCGGVEATTALSGTLGITFTNTTSQTLTTQDLNYVVERNVEEQWGVVSGPNAVPTDTLTLTPGETITWTWGASDNLGEVAPEGEYRVALVGVGDTAQSGSAAGGALAPTGRTQYNYYYLGGQRIGMRKTVPGPVTQSYVYYLHGDHLGSTSDVTTGTAPASLYARERYYPYGQVRYQYQTSPTSYNFTGQRLDSYIKWIEMAARWYDPYLLATIPLAGSPTA